MKKILLYALAVLSVISLTVGLFSACSGTKLYSEGEGNLKVVCTNFPPFDFARAVGGDKITVTILQDNGADLHNYTPTTATLDALAAADVFICVGGESDEKWIDDAIESANNSSLTVIKLVDCVELQLETTEKYFTGDHKYYFDRDDHDHDHGDEEHEHEHDEEEYDEHVWTSLRNAGLICVKISEVFSEKDKENASYYSERLASYKEKLDALDESFAEAISGKESKEVVFADRFPFVYLLNDYEIGFIAAFSGCSAEVDASFETQTVIINAVKELGVPAVIVIEGDGKPLAESVKTETGCKIISLDSIQSVKRQEIENGVTYLDIMKDNLDNLKEALK